MGPLQTTFEQKKINYGKTVLNGHYGFLKLQIYCGTKTETI